MTKNLNSTESIELSRNVGIEIEGNTLNRRECHEAITKSSIPELKNALLQSAFSTDVWVCATDPTTSFEVKTSPTKNVFAINEGMIRLVNAGATVGSNCGTHVNVDITDYDLNDLKNLCKLWAQWENCFFSLVSRSRRGGGWSGRHHRTNTESAYNRVIRRIDSASNLRELRRANGQDGRYMAMNMYPVRFGCPSSRVEFRLHQGTLNPTKITNFCRALCLLVDAGKRGVQASEFVQSTDVEAMLDHLCAEGTSAPVQPQVPMTPVPIHECRIAGTDTRRGRIWDHYDMLMTRRHGEPVNGNWEPTLFPRNRTAGVWADDAYDSLTDETERYCSVQLAHWRRTRTEGRRQRRSRRNRAQVIVTAEALPKVPNLKAYLKGRQEELNRN